VDGAATGDAHILVVEDDESIRFSLAEMLRLEGYRVSEAAHGQAAIERLDDRAQPPVNLILLDLMMPVMNGWEFLEIRRTNDRLTAIPVVVISAAGRRPPEGAYDAYLRKPVELEELLSVVRSYVGDSPAGSSPPGASPPGASPPGE
jgi:two-component system, chemotaxis family, chemotaxis protein CheY